MRKLKRLFAILIMFALAITAMPMIEAKAEENMYEITIYKIYANTEGNGVCDTFYEAYPEGTLFGDIYDEYVAYDTEEQMLTDGFLEWDLSYSRDEIVDGNPGSIYIIADYQDYNMVEFIASYSEEYDGEILDVIDRNYAYVENSIAQSEIALEEYFIQNYSAYANHAQSLGFIEWEAGVPVNWDNDTEWDSFRLTASYANPKIINKTVYKSTYAQNSVWKEESETIRVAETASMDEIIAQLTPGNDVAGLKFEGWDVTEVYDDSIYVTARYDKAIVLQSTLSMTESAEILHDTNTVYLDRNITYRDVLNLLEPAASTAESTFTGWKLFDETISLDDRIGNVETIDFIATYDKYPILIEKVYIDNTGSLKVEETTKYYNAGTSIVSIYNENKTAPADALNNTVVWFDEDYEGEVSLLNNFISYLAKYDDKVIVNFQYDYIADRGDCGENIYGPHYEVLDRTIAQSEDRLQAYFTNTVIPKLNITHYKKLDLLEWHPAGADDLENDGCLDRLYFYAEYDTSDTVLVHAWIRDKSGDYVWAAEAGQSITLPYNYNGYYLTWYDDMGNEAINDVYTVPSDAQKGDFYYLEARKAGKIPTKNEASASFVDKYSVLPPSATISSYQLKSGPSYDLGLKLIDELGMNVLNQEVYEINLHDKDGYDIHKLNGNLEVTVKLGFDKNPESTLLVYRYVEKDNTLEKCDVIDAGTNYVSFLTYHFSTFIIVEVEGVPLTADTTNVFPYAMLLTAGIGVFLAGKKRYKL